MTLKLFSIRAPRKIHHFKFASFSENAQGAQSGTHLFCNLEGQQSAVHQKNFMRTQILGYAKNICWAPGLVLIKLRQSVDIKISSILAFIYDNVDSLQNEVSTVLQTCLAF